MLEYFDFAISGRRVPHSSITTPARNFFRMRHEAKLQSKRDVPIIEGDCVRLCTDGGKRREQN